MESLPPNVRVVAPDLRGCGDTDKPGAAWTMDDLATDVALFAHALGINRYAVVGHSLGGGVALQLAVAQPEAVERLVLINSAPAEGLKTPPEKYAQLELVIRTPALMQAAVGAMMPTAPQDSFYWRLLEESVTKSVGALIRNGHALDEMDLSAAVRNLQLPTLILYGGKDPLVSRAMMERTRDQMPQAELEVWPEIGHSAPVEAPARLAARLVSFLGLADEQPATCG